MALSGSLTGGASSSPTPPASTLLTDLISAWDQVGADLVGSNNLTQQGGVATGVGKVNALCSDFERSAGGDRFVLLNAAAGDMQPNQTMSWSFWVKPETLADFLGIYGKGTGNEERLFIHLTGALQFRHNNALAYDAGAGLSNGTWAHIATTWDQGTLTAESWIDGAMVASATGVAGSTNTADWYLGSTGSLDFDGLIDQPCLWHKVLTPAEIAEIYNGGAGLDFVP